MDNRSAATGSWDLVTEMPREAIYKKLSGRGGIFSEGAAASLNEGARYSLKTSPGELWTGRVEFLAPPRGFCMNVDSLNDALAWLKIEGATVPHDVQLWFSTYGLTQSRVSEIETRGAEELNKILV